LLICAKSFIHNVLKILSKFSFAKLLLICAKSFIYNALEILSKFSFAKQMT